MINSIIFHKALFIFIVLDVCFIGNYIIRSLLNGYMKKIAIRTKTKHDDELIPLVRRLTTFAICGTGIVFLLIELGVNVTGLYATAGAGSICTAMLLKNSITNIVAGVTLMFDRPFRIGDEIKLVSGDVGKVLKIGLRRTNILIPRTKDKGKSILVIPNKDLDTAKIYNYTLAKEFDNGQEAINENDQK